MKTTKTVRKKAFLWLGAALAAMSSWFAPGIQAQGEEGPLLVAYWDFNDASNPEVAVDKILGLEGKLLNGALYSGDGWGRTLQPGDQALDLDQTSEGQIMWVDKGGFLNYAASKDQMTVSFWEIWWNPPVSSSAFWGVSPSSADVQRGIQAHVPWSNGNIYFDTAGCCDLGTQRIYQALNADTFPDYYDGFWLEWHHFVFLKDGATKRIYIDGKLFHEGVNTAPLPQDFVGLSVGGRWDETLSIQGMIDDFAVFGSALSESDIAALASGTPPDQLPGAQTPQEAIVLSASPVAGSANPPKPPVKIEIREGANPIDPASVQLYLDDALIEEAQVVKSGKLVAVQHEFAEPLPPGSTHALRVEYNDGEPRSIEYSFSVVEYAVLSAEDQVDPDTSKPGFIWNIHQSLQQTSNLSAAEDQLAGLRGDNLAYDGALGPAIDVQPPPPDAPQLPMRFDIESVINMESTGADAGEFNPNDTFPGIDGLGEAGFNDFAVEIITYVELPAGLTTLIVNSDDGFRVVAGQIRDVLRRQTAGEFNGTRGAADTICYLYAPEEGVYPVRIVYFQRGGGASLELKIVKPDGTHVLLNDTANGSPPCYRAILGQLPAAITSVSPAPGAVNVEPDAPVEVTIEETSAAVDLGSIVLKLDGQPVAAQAAKSGKVATVSYQPEQWLDSAHTYTAEITFAAGAEQRTDQWQFTVKTYYPNTLVAYWPFNDASTPDVSLDVVGQVPALLQNGAAFTPDGGGFSGQPGDRAIDFGHDASEQLTDITNAVFLAKAIERDQVTVCFWQKAYNTGVNQTAVWFVSPSCSHASRGLSAQVPWSDNGIYYDTGGCCDAGTQRINRSITQFEDYTDDSFWLEWHHFAFTKNGTLKRIYIDGKLFHQGNNTLPLPADISEILLGAEPATGDPPVHNNSLQGLMDEVAIFANEVPAPDIALLAAGASPLDILPPQAPEISVSLSEGKVVLEWEGEATLLSAPAVTGPWTEVTGASSPYQAVPAEKMMFYRLRQ